METRINGLLIVETEYSGTKSEADYAYLLASDDVRYRCTVQETAMPMMTISQLTQTFMSRC